MIKYDTILEMAMEIVDNKFIPKEGLVIIYELNDEHHRKLDEDFFYRINTNSNVEFIHNDIIEVNVGGIEFKFIKKNLQD
jgi:hypothetical protein